ncbi:hornerin-like isoform X1 [Anopheles stephensi]|uniref:hornerin-like isoform X1 n=1 Tax=Anopheles stephensi TaxID=30069 RepID=UPI001658918F|nr:hornerin-like isoform X1 [Anopheles stephensi]XP_035917138.1 hornerin-like isoform X1 [Anopheles stephensi]XP_035917139.1 hornerin-like isoform X1 [Anopheles stephensi]XP_035917140.1 hornerin-like isoform X1 [Anopheles stephensi]XP_035917141.1 hornerin-like isoform X1 [Anopheles stephensi]XP_035917142.1 hornerin-like isoform X1 [Anopheles stephensi]XP_035917143.1 hornerin-like isoform X1 [Anopheles stephensi]XP_035917144.1 hornerin-like isoform X1 [Anopheles stephensi]XP_035917145.1 horn
MDCCSSSSYGDYRHHSMNGNAFCYPYSPNMLRSASPYPLATGARYGSTDYRSSPLGGYHHHHGGGYDGGAGYDKYYGSYHHASASSYQAGYYGNYPTSYRDYGSYGHYYHQSQSPYARGGGSGGPAGSHGYGGASSSGGSYLYPGRHYPASSLAHPAFGSARESAYYHAQREQHHHQQQQQQYSSFANYGHLPTPYRNGVGPGEHPGGKSHQPSQQPYPPQQTFAGSHNERGMSASGESQTISAGHPSPPNSTLFGAQNGYSSPRPDYTPLPTSSYSSGDSPQHPLAGQQADADEGDGPPTTPTPSTALLGATAAEFPHGTKDNRMRKPKERKLHRGYGGGGGSSGRSSRASSPAAVNGLSGSNGAAAATRMKSLDALTNLCWPEEDQFPGRMRKYSTANGLKAKDGSNGRKESNELETAGTASPSRTAGPARRTKKQTPSGGRQSKETKSAAESREKQTNGASPPTTAPAVENKNITPLPGFQQAFGSTEIGKFSEVFFNSSPTSGNSHSPPDLSHHHHHHHPLQLQEHQQQQTQQSQPVPSQSNGTMQQLVMESLNAYESDVDTLSPSQAWDSSGPGPGGGGGGGGDPGYNLPIGTTFHPSYYESSSYSDHAVDSPLGNYFSEMTCNEFVN